jgi:hypothetical protein
VYLVLEAVVPGPGPLLVLRHPSRLVHSQIYAHKDFMLNDELNVLMTLRLTS